MIECIYTNPPCFSQTIKKEKAFEIDILGVEGRKNLQKANDELGLALDEADFDYYYDFFLNKIQKNPTDVELFDLAQSNSEHSRHWFFRGELYVNGEKRPESLFKSIQDTQKYSNKNNVIAFCDNSSAITGFESEYLVSTNPTKTAALSKKSLKRHIIYTAETHNFPTGVCPFPGAATGTGGRIRDVHATGRGAHEIAGIAGYSIGNLNLNNYPQSYEPKWDYPNNFATPAKILIEASNGASDYGNKFGEPVIAGFTRSFGMQLPNSKRYEYVKPIMFSAGIGSIDSNSIKKAEAKKGQLVAKVGGPVYRIGVGGGAASSVQVQGDQKNELDFGAVQRGDPEMEQKLHRVIRGCIELGDKNPILSIHDQGAGGNGNVLKEIVEGKNGGAIIKADTFDLGDPTVSIRELWGAEYQESDAILIDPLLVDELKSISSREKCRVNIVGEVTGDNRIIVKNYINELPEHPVDLDLTKLSERESKVFHLRSDVINALSLELPPTLTVKEALNQVLRLPTVGSKRYLTNKVDRSVTGLIAQQQCVGPLHTPVADDVKCSGNWMWAAKVDGEGGKLVQACDAMCTVMKTLGIAVDGGKDSLSMAARCKNNEIICSPGTLVVSTYAPCTDIQKVVTPDFKIPDEAPTVIVYVSMANPRQRYRLGGSALAQCYSQLGNEFPDMDSPEYFKKAFNVVQKIIQEELIFSGHDVSDGGIITALLEMAFAGNCEIHASITSQAGTLETLFAEELGIILEVSHKNLGHLLAICDENDILVQKIGEVVQIYGKDASIIINVNGNCVIDCSLNELRNIWEETSDRLELLQTAENCVKTQIEWRSKVCITNYVASFDFNIDNNFLTKSPKIAILREEGSNGDREMAAAFISVGFEAFDITMTDLANDGNFDQFRGIAFVGGFSFADVLGSAKGWAATINFNEKICKMFETFKNRKDTFSLGICNGCQLMALINWIGDSNVSKGKVFLDDNDCGRFHSGFCSVKIQKSPAIMLQGMEDSILGVWTSHGEGKFTYDSAETEQYLEKQNLRCIRYCDNSGHLTNLYPANPNGSSSAVAGICSSDGRHLAMMPHPDRSFLTWQWPNYPKALKLSHSNFTPWIKMFKNAYEWCIEGRQ
uniref:Formylglycinamide ribonucleotide amidotransferase n=1 Tax=Panagrolaimus sp. ES5 TaxID=591445 RepID=A0AC34F5M4_9BILA